MRGFFFARSPANLSRMNKGDRFAVVLVTAPNLTVARQLARGALAEKLVACANLFPRIESHYWWRGKVETGSELQIVFKTTKNKLAALERFVLRQHPYDTPEFIALPLAGGSKRYLNWISETVG